MDERLIDRPGPVRRGEELPIEGIGAFLRERFPDLEGPPVVEQYPGGYSNLTYRVRFGGRELVLRRPPVGSRVKTAHDMSREHRILSRLPDVFPLAPRALAYCENPEVIGAPFYVMERVRGIILRGQRPPPGLELPAAVMRRLAESAVDALAALHAVDPAACGLGDLGRPQGYVERQVRGWTERWLNARTDDAPEVDRAAGWLAGHLPGESGAALIHNDFKIDNLVLDPHDLSRIVAVLDWEMATVGDPLMDLGTSLGYWIDPDDPEEYRRLPIGLAALPGNLSRTEVAARYAERSGRDVSGVLFYYVYGLFKVAVIAQQIYYRFKQGLTRDPRFGALLDAVRVLGRTAARAIDRGRIDCLGA